MDGLVPTNIILYLMLTVCIVLVAVDIIEILKLQNIWNLKSTVDSQFYQTCIKPDLLVKTAFSCFSLLAAISASLLVGLMIISMDFFLLFHLNSLLYLNYMVFGLYMLAMTIFGMFHWNDVAYICDTKTGKRIYSIGNIFSLIGCFILSLIITLGVNIYETLELYSNSILRRDDGSDILRNLFWKTVFNGRNEYLNNISGDRRVRLMNPVLINHNLNNDVNNQGNNNNNENNNENNNNIIDNENKDDNLIDNENKEENTRLILDESN
jgi:hypothetical protein